MVVENVRHIKGILILIQGFIKLISKTVTYIVVPKLEIGRKGNV